MHMASAYLAALKRLSKININYYKPIMKNKTAVRGRVFSDKIVGKPVF